MARNPSRSRPRPRPGRRLDLRVEQLESRTLLSIAYAPAQIIHAYALDQMTTFTYGGGVIPGNTIPADGRGQTIDIVDAYDDQSILSDLQTFDARYNLPDPGYGTFTFAKATPQGLPSVNKGWAAEIAVDVEWAHAIAPGASILLVETKTNDLNDLLTGVDYAVGQGASVVSMSWGTGEFAAETTASYDGHFAGHPGVTFVAASGDNGAPPSWPAISTQVVAVGGTTLRLNPDNTRLTETGWGSGSSSALFGGSGGGISKYEPKPDYQSGVTKSATKRTNPDVSYDANPSTGFSVYNSQGSGWTSMGGTSAGAPQWAAIFAIVNEGRVLAGQGPLNTISALEAIYAAPASAFFDVTSGNNGYAAGPGYDLVTGRGSPNGGQLIPTLVSASNVTIFAPVVSGGPTIGTSQPAHHRARPGVIDGGATSVVVIAPAATILLQPANVPASGALLTVFITPGAPTLLVPASLPGIPVSFSSSGRIESGAGADDKQDPPADQPIAPRADDDSPSPAAPVSTPGAPISVQPTGESLPALPEPTTDEPLRPEPAQASNRPAVPVSERFGWERDTVAATAVALFLLGPRATPLADRKSARTRLSVHVFEGSIR